MEINIEHFQKITNNFMNNMKFLFSAPSNALAFKEYLTVVHRFSRVPSIISGDYKVNMIFITISRYYLPFILHQHCTVTAVGKTSFLGINQGNGIRL